MKSKYHDAFFSIKHDIHFILTNELNWELSKNGIRNFETLEEACNKAATYDEKETAKDVIHDSGLTFCPSCKIPFVSFGIHVSKLALLSYCPNCGQRIHIKRR